MRVGVTLWFGWGGVVSGCRLKHYWSIHVEFGGWGLMTVWNREFISPGMCKLIYTTSEFIQETSSKNIQHTKKTQ